MCSLFQKETRLIPFALLITNIFRFLKTQLIKEVKADVSDVMFQKRLALLADTFCHLNEDTNITNAD